VAWAADRDVDNESVSVALAVHCGNPGT
jgi:hypothetical protein